MLFRIVRFNIIHALSEGSLNWEVRVRIHYWFEIFYMSSLTWCRTNNRACGVLTRAHHVSKIMIDLPFRLAGMLRSSSAYVMVCSPEATQGGAMTALIKGASKYQRGKIPFRHQAKLFSRDLPGDYYLHGTVSAARMIECLLRILDPVRVGNQPADVDLGRLYHPKRLCCVLV